MKTNNVLENTRMAVRSLNVSVLSTILVKMAHRYTTKRRRWKWLLYEYTRTEALHSKHAVFRAWSYATGRRYRPDAASLTLSASLPFSTWDRFVKNYVDQGVVPAEQVGHRGIRLYLAVVCGPLEEKHVLRCVKGGTHTTSSGGSRRTTVWLNEWRPRFLVSQWCAETTREGVRGLPPASALTLSLRLVCYRPQPPGAGIMAHLPTWHL